MKQRKYDDIYVLPVGNHHVIHSPLRGVSAISDTLGIGYLYDILVKNESDKTKQESVKYLLNAIEGSSPKYPEEHGKDIHPYFLGLIPTRSCNGACIYCGFDNKGETMQDMNYGTAIAAVDWMIDCVKELKRDKLEVHFFGGEPLFTPDIVSVAIHYARIAADRHGLSPHFEISTNGQVSDRTSRFVTEHFHSVVLSLDGTEEVHNRNRPLRNGKGSFKQAVRFAKSISNSHVDLCLRTCVSNENTDLLPEITQWFCETFQPSVINFENLKSNKDSARQGLLEPDPFEFSRQFNRALDIAEHYGTALINSTTSNEDPQYSSCPVGKDTVIVGPDGLIHSCYLLPGRWKEKGLDLTIGEIKDYRVQIHSEKIIGLRELVKKKPRCTNCFCQWTCSGGCHVDVTYPGSGSQYDNYCRQTRILGLTKILRNLGQKEILNNGFEDEEWMHNFSVQDSDRLIDWL